MASTKITLLNEDPDVVMMAIYRILGERKIHYFEPNQSIFYIKCVGSKEPFEFRISVALNYKEVVVYFQQYSGDPVPCKGVAEALRESFEGT